MYFRNYNKNFLILIKNVRQKVVEIDQRATFLGSASSLVIKFICGVLCHACPWHSKK